MAKAKPRAKNGRRKAQRPRRAQVPRNLRMGNESERYLALITDPCNGPLGAYYGGENGIVQRFVSDVTLNTGVGQTCGVIAFIPAGNVFVNGGAATPSTSFTPSSSGGPGVGFFATQANKTRALAACVTVMPSAVSATNMTGEIACTIASSNAVDAGTSTTVDTVFALCNQRSVLAKRSYDVKWYPALMDSTYSPLQASGAATLSDPADQNAIVVAWRGYPAATALSFRLTVVVEWTPRQGSNIALNSAPQMPVEHQKLNAALYQHNNKWWHNIFSETASHAISEAGKGIKYLTSLGVQEAVRYGGSSLLALAA